MASRGIFGGSFDPPHLGHLIIAERFANESNLNIVTWIPAGFPPHKDSIKLTSAEKRLEMTRLAIEKNEHFEVSDIEIAHNKPPWTVFTLEYFREIHPLDSLFLLIGSDSLSDLHSWKDFERIFDLATVCVVRRPGFALENPKLPFDLLSKVKIIESPMIEISASEIRRLVSVGASIKYLVPDAVIEYIEKNKLYLNFIEGAQ